MDETEGSYPAAHDASFGRCQVSTHAGPRCPGLRDVHPGQKDAEGIVPDLYSDLFKFTMEGKLIL